ncbi:MAG TPA: hypothetical protein VK601_24350 [Kofleriaceae bacterium]|nr:hypothetical protein [Kofleriaceae bacterium]
MPAAASIAVINRDQLATATDRLLLGGRVKVRRSARALPYPRASGTGSFPLPAAPLAQGSQACIALDALAGAPPAPAPRRAQVFDAVDPYERTVRVAPVRRRSPYAQLAALLIAVPALVGAAIGIAALL